MLLPGEVWSRPSSDLELDGFDQELHYVQPQSRSLFDPFLLLENGTWEACPCAPGSQLTIAGQDLADTVARDPQGRQTLGRTTVLVDERPANIFLASPTQVNFTLPNEVQPPMARVTVLRDGRIRGQDVVAVRAAAPDGQPVEQGLAEIGPDSLSLTAPAGREPAVHLITTPLSFRASFSVTVREQAGGAVPIRVTFWNPRNFSSFDLVFEADGQMRAMFLEGRGRIAKLDKLGPYEVGVPQRVSVEWRRGEEVSLTVAGHGGERRSVLPAELAPALFDAYRPSLSVVAAGRDGSASVLLTHYQLTLLPGRFTTVRADDAMIAPVMLAVSLLGGALLLPTLVRLRPPAVGSAVRSVRRRAIGVRGMAALLLLGGSFLGLNAFLFTLGSHPFDMGAEKIWAYSAVRYGMTDLYYVAQTATLADVWNGMPYHEAVFPYNLGMAYYFSLIGHTHLLIFGHASPDSMSLEVTIKAFNLAFMIADAVLVYALLRTLRPSSTLLPGLGSALVLFNPAFVFDTAVWGETESVPVFFLLASLLAALKDRPALAWVLLAACFLTKQTVLPAVLVIGVYYLLRFPWRQNLEGVSMSVILAAIASLPFTLNGYPPSVVLDPTLAVLWVHGGTGAERVFQVVSFDAFNLWTLVTMFRDGAQGLERFHLSDHVPALGSLSYHEIGSGLLILSILGILVWLLAHRKEAEESPHFIFIVVALVFLAELFLPTRSIARYFVFTLVFTSFGIAGRARWPALFAYAALTFTTLVGMYGSVASALEFDSSLAPSLAPEYNPVSRLVLNLFRSDVVITVGAILNGAAAAGLALAVWLDGSPERRKEGERVLLPSSQPAPSRIAEDLGVSDA